MRESTFSFWEDTGFVFQKDAAYLPEFDAFHPPENDYASETWFFEALGEEGHLVQIAVATKNPLLVPCELRPMVRIGVFSPGQPALVVEETYAAADFEASKDHCSLRLGGGTIESNGTEYRVSLNMRDISLDLSFQPTVAPWVPGSGQITYGDKGLDTWRWSVPVPRAMVQGRLTAGQQHMQIQGTGYHDHRGSTFKLPGVLNRAEWGRIYAGEETVIFANVTGAQLYQWKSILPVLWVKKNEVLNSSDKAELVWAGNERDPRTQAKYPTTGLLRLYTQSQMQVKLHKLRVCLAGSLHPEAGKVENQWRRPAALILVGEAEIIESIAPAAPACGGAVMERIEF